MAVTINASTTSGLQLTSDTSGAIQFQTNGSDTVGINTSGQLTSSSGALVLPTSGTITVPNGTGTIAVKGISSSVVFGTSVASTSGSAIEFTGVPSWVRRITVMFVGVQSNGVTAPLIQLGSGSYQTSGYLGSMNFGTTWTSFTTGLVTINTGSPSSVRHGIVTIQNITGNSWVSSSSMSVSNTANGGGGGSSVSLSGTLDRLRITVGADAFTAGTINITWE